MGLEQAMVMRLILVAAIILVSFEAFSAAQAEDKCKSTYTVGGEFKGYSDSDLSQVWTPFNEKATAEKGHPVWYNLISCKKLKPGKTFADYAKCMNKGKK